MNDVYAQVSKALLTGPVDPVTPSILFWVGISCIGFVLWLYAYALAMRYGNERKSYALPWLAVCFNFSWEVLASVFWDMQFQIWHIGCVLWMLFDLGIVYQVWMHGAAQQRVPELRRNFHSVLVLSFLACLLAQYTYTKWSYDHMGVVDSFMINLIMSIAFIYQYFERREYDDLTYGIAWAKMFGTGIVSLTMIPLFPWLYPNRDGTFLAFLCIGIVVADCIYIGLLRSARQRTTELTEGRTNLLQQPRTEGAS